MNTETKTIPLENIKFSKDNRMPVVDDALKELAASIEQKGLLQRPIVKQIEGTEDYEIVVGARRIKACSLTDMKQVTVEVLLNGVSPAEVHEIRIIENLRRKDLHPLEMAEQIQTLQKKHKLTLDAIRTSLGMTQASLENYAALLRLHPKWAEVFKPGSILGEMTLSRMLVIARYPQEAQAILFDEIKPTSTERFDSYKKALFVTQPLQDLHASLAKNMLAKLPGAWATKGGENVNIAGVPCCVDCTKRVGANAHLFPEMSSVNDQCLDKSCWFAKQTGYLCNRLEEVNAKQGNGLGVLLIRPDDYELCNMLNDQGIPMIPSYAVNKAKKTDAKSVPALTATGKTVRFVTVRLDSSTDKDVAAIVTKHIEAKAKATKAKPGAKATAPAPAAGSTEAGKPKLSMGDHLYQKCCKAVIPVIAKCREDMSETLRPSMVPGWDDPTMLIGYMLAIGLDTRTPGCDIERFHLVNDIAAHLFSTNMTFPSGTLGVSTYGESVPQWMMPKSTKIRMGDSIPMSVTDALFCHFRDMLDTRMSGASNDGATHAVRLLAQARLVSGWWAYPFATELEQAIIHDVEYPKSWLKKQTKHTLDLMRIACIQRLLAYSEIGDWEKADQDPLVLESLNTVGVKSILPTWGKQALAAQKKGAK